MSISSNAMASTMFQTVANLSRGGILKERRDAEKVPFQLESLFSGRKSDFSGRIAGFSAENVYFQRPYFLLGLASRKCWLYLCDVKNGDDLVLFFLLIKSCFYALIAFHKHLIIWVHSGNIQYLISPVTVQFLHIIRKICYVLRHNRSSPT
jgi:hypothetical protein